MSEICFRFAHRTPTSYSDDILTPFQDIGMGGWSDEMIRDFFASKSVIDIGSGFEGIARRLYKIFGDSPDAPMVVNLNPQFTDWRMGYELIDSKYVPAKVFKRTDIEKSIKTIMGYSGEDYIGYMENRTAVAGIFQALEYPDGYFDIQISTWAFPNVLYDCGGRHEDAADGYRELSRTQSVGGLALLAPIRPRERQSVVKQLSRLGVDRQNYVFKPATKWGDVLEYRAHSTALL